MTLWNRYRNIIWDAKQKKIYKKNPKIGPEFSARKKTAPVNDDGTKRLGGKDTNPKDAVGVKKWRQYCTVPMTVIWELGVAMLEGARKYGRHNYRVSGVRASVYVDAAKGHIDCYWEGEDIDEDSKLHHITKAMASLAVLRDAQIQGMCIDDRPPKTDIPAISARLQQSVEDIIARYPDPIPPYTELDLK